jgi:hypothetical protein
LSVRSWDEIMVVLSRGPLRRDLEQILALCRGTPHVPQRRFLGGIPAQNTLISTIINNCTVIISINAKEKQYNQYRYIYLSMYSKNHQNPCLTDEPLAFWKHFLV